MKCTAGIAVFKPVLNVVKDQDLDTDLDTDEFEDEDSGQIDVYEDD